MEDRTVTTIDKTGALRDALQIATMFRAEMREIDRA
jgi:hypothetical protein